MTTSARQHQRLWESLRHQDRSAERAVGGDFDTVGTLEFALLRHLGLRPDHSVVDVGSGSGRLAVQLAPWLRGPYLGTDVVPDLLDHARCLCRRPDWTFSVSAGRSIPAPDASADFVCFFSVFTHIRHLDTYRYVLEAARVLRPGGRLVCSFLEYRIRSHWAVFSSDFAADDPDAPLNEFMGRDALEAFASNAGLGRPQCFDGDTPHIPIERELVFENGYRVRGLGNLGQSVCVMQKPERPV